MDTDSEKLTPLVSILMVTYNRLPYIRDAINSVRAQTYSTWELIVVDDGSTDGTGDVVAAYHDPRIRFIRHSENKGVHAARTRALEEARGKYIAVLDSDDLWSDSGKLEAQVSFLESHQDYALLGTFITTIDENGDFIAKKAYCTDDSSIRTNILLRNQFAHSSVLMRARMVRDAGGYQKVLLGEDLDLFLRLGLHGKFSNLPAYMTSYRIHNEGLSRDGVLMARAVLGFIKKYRTRYPNSFKARIKGLLVLMVGQLRDTRTVRS